MSESLSAHARESGPILAAKQYFDQRALGAFREASSDGSAFVQLASVTCRTVTFTNTSGADFLVKRGSGTVYITIPSGGGKTFDVQANASELSVKRSSAGSSAAIQYECGGEAI